MNKAVAGAAIGTHAMEKTPRPGRPQGWLRSVKAVAWAFLGIRKNRDYQDDLGRLNPLHVIATALLAVLAFVGGLIALVHWVVQ